MTRVAVMLAVILALVPTGIAGAQEDGTVSPPPGERPVPVHLGLWLLSISALDEILSTFQLEADVISSWTDPRLAFEPYPGQSGPRIYQGTAVDEMMAKVWTPLGYVANSVGMITQGRRTLAVHPDGRCIVESRIQLTVRAPLDFRRFPFDDQVLRVHVESFAWDDRVLEILPNEEHTGFSPEFFLTEWTLGELDTRTSLASRGRGGQQFSRLTFEIGIERRTGFYLWKVVLPLITIVAISWVVFYMKREGLGRRAGVSVTGMLTVIAYQFIVAGSLPKVSYLTAIDRIVLASLLTIAGTMVVNVIVDYRPTADPDQVHRADRIARWLFPLGYLVVLAFVAARNGIL